MTQVPIFFSLNTLSKRNDCKNCRQLSSFYCFIFFSIVFTFPKFTISATKKNHCNSFYSQIEMVTSEPSEETQNLQYVIQLSDYAKLNLKHRHWYQNKILMDGQYSLRPDFSLGLETQVIEPRQLHVDPKLLQENSFLLLALNEVAKRYVKDKQISESDAFNIVYSHIFELSQHSIHLVTHTSKFKEYKEDQFNLWPQNIRPLSSIYHKEIKGMARLVYKFWQGKKWRLPIEIDSNRDIFSENAFSSYNQIIELSRYLAAGNDPLDHLDQFIKTIEIVTSRAKYKEEDKTLVVAAIHNKSLEKVWKSWGFKTVPDYESIKLNYGGQATIMAATVADLLPT